jgi:hypothetical protein
MSVQNSQSLLTRLAQVVDDLRLLVIKLERLLRAFDKLLLRLALILFILFDFALVFYILYMHFGGK